MDQRFLSQSVMNISPRKPVAPPLSALCGCDCDRGPGTSALSLESAVPFGGCPECVRLLTRRVGGRNATCHTDATHAPAN
jgi:hypothetical protein